MTNEQIKPQEKKETLRSILERFGRVAVAFSAGVDSTFLLKTARDVLSDRVIAVTGRTVSSPEREIQEAVSFCDAHKIRQIIVDIDQLSIPGFADNPPQRCYLCKKELFRAFRDISRESGFDHLIEGTNADDTHDYRPGLRALAELEVRSPLKEAGLTKQDIRVLSREMGLSTWDKPSLACLATRIPYGETITQEKLSAIDRAEQLLQDAGFRQVRVRLHGRLARIETEPALFQRMTEPHLAKEISQRLAELGFDYVTLDLNGYMTGSMNKTII